MQADSFRLQRRTAMAAALLLPYVARSQEPRPSLGVHYVPTPPAVVQKMLELGQVKSSDLLYDLGCGDGRIVVAAAKERGARGVGIDLDPTRISEAKANARQAGVVERTRFEMRDLYTVDLSEASVVTLYLLPEMNLRLGPQLWRQLKVGSRVVSHAFSMGDEWPPERRERVDNATVYMWTIGEQQKNAVTRMS